METIKGIVVGIYFSADDFCAGRLRLNGSSDTVNFAGKVSATEGDAVTLCGSWVKHAKYGEQFKAAGVVYDLSMDKEGLAAWLAMNPDAPGIGPVRGRRVAEEFGDRFEEALAKEPEKIAAVAGVPVEDIRSLAAAWAKRQEFNRIATKLAGWKLTKHQIEKLLAEYGPAVVSILEDNPYVLIGKIDGFGFRTVDDIAMKLGIAKTHPGRVQAAIRHALLEALDSGSTVQAQGDMIGRVEELLVLDGLDHEEVIGNGFNDFANSPQSRCYDDGRQRNYAFNYVAKIEEYLLGRLRDGKLHNPHITPEAAPALLSAHAGDLDKYQRLAVFRALTSRISIITGGAGSGKTTSIRALVKICQATNLDISLCAPTGKAARRMEEVISAGLEAKTIHRMLEYHPAYGFRRCADMPLGADIIIVDEVSMVDVVLAYHLFQAVPHGSAVVFVGDHHQLPPVGAGALLRDCIARNLTPVALLEFCHRQAGPLKHNCSAILGGQVAPTVKMPGRERGPWYVIDALDEHDDILAQLERLFTEIIPKWGLDRLRDVQFLTPIHKGPIGTKAINALFQRLHQKSLGVEVPEVPEGERPRLFAGDRVIQTKNNYDLEIMNGHQGVVVEADPLLIDFDSSVKAIPNDCVGEVELAYCLTPHKCQGSEWPVVVTVCHRSHTFMLHRNWLYTATTRAKETSIILGDQKSIHRAARTVRANERKTLLDLLSK